MDLRIKIDFGRLLPGLLIFMVGVALLALWFVLALVSFFFFFVPVLQGIFYFGLDILVASLVLMGSGVLIMLAGVSWWRRTNDEDWISRIVSRRVSRDVMPTSQRAGEVIGLVVSFLVLLFFFENQVQGTGFFTSSFGLPEQVLFYGVWLFGAAVSIVRAAYGRRNAIRPLEAIQAAIWAFSAFWLLSVFPFNFAHIMDLLPSTIHPLFSWVTNPVGALILLVTGIGSLANLVYTSILYSVVRARQMGSMPHRWAERRKSG